MAEIYKYKCDSCKYYCNYISQWNKHISTELHKTGKRKIRTDKDKNLKCKQCEYTGKNMKLHVLNTHGTKEERKAGFKYYCVYCDFGTLSNKFFETHCATEKHKNIITLLQKNNEIV